VRRGEIRRRDDAHVGAAVVPWLEVVRDELPFFVGEVAVVHELISFSMYVI
jgi:hypothetical protein